MMKEGIPERRASISKTTRGNSNVDTRLEEEIEGGRAKLTRWHLRSCKNVEPTYVSIADQRCGVNGVQE